MFTVSVIRAKERKNRKMKTKRIISFIAAAAMVFSLWSCGDRKTVPELKREVTENIKSGQTAEQTGYRLTSYFDTLSLKDADKIKADSGSFVSGAGRVYLHAYSDGLYDSDMEILAEDTDMKTMERGSQYQADAESAGEPVYPHRGGKYDDDIDGLVQNYPELKRMFCYASLKSSAGDTYCVFSDKYDFPYLIKFDSAGRMVYRTEPVYSFPEGYEVFGIAETPEGKIIVTGYEGIGTTVQFNPDDGSTELEFEVNGIDGIFGYAGGYLICRTVNGEIKGYSYEDDSFVTISESRDGLSLYNAAVEGDTVRTYYTKSGKRKNRFYLLDNDGGIVSQTVVETDDETSPAMMCVNSKGELIVMFYTLTVQSEDGEMYEASKYSLYRIDGEGNSEKLAETPYNKYETHICGMVTDSDCNIFVFRDLQDMGSVAEVYSRTGELVCSEEMEFSWPVVSSIQGKIFFSGGYEGELSEIKYDDGKLVFTGASYDLSEQFGSLFEMHITDSGSEDCYYIKEEGNIYRCSLGSSEKTEIFNWSECDAETADSGIAIADEDTFFTFEWADNKNEDGYGYSYNPVILKKADSARLDELNKRKILVVAGKSSYNVSGMIKKFNRENDDCLAVWKSLSAEQGEGAQSMLAESVANGYTPDILVSSGMMDITPLAAMGAFADIRELMKDDPQIKYEDIMPNIAEACTYNGTMYMVFPYYSMDSMAAKESVAGSAPGWTYTQVCDLLDADSDMLFAEYADLYDLLEVYISENVDFEAGTCSFDTDDFKKLLRISVCDSYHEEHNEDEYDYDYGYEDDDDWYNPFRGLKDNRYLTKMYDVLLPEASYCIDEKAVVKSVPSSSGKPYIVISPDEIFSVMKTSENREGAWKFIREFFTDTENPKNIMYMNGMSVMKKYSEYGEITLADIAENSGNTDLFLMYDEDMNEFRIPGYDDMDRKLIHEYMNSGVAVSGLHSDILDIILDEYIKYEEGEADADQTAASVQNKVMLYLSEVI